MRPSLICFPHLLSILRVSYSKQANSGDNAPILSTCKCPDSCLREVGLGDCAATFSVDLLGRHCRSYGGIEEAAQSISLCDIL